ncbi:hypothetical protein BAE44_0001551 [Dichanthelium oligosanthes]|uniref:Uncharacterized protein n=1 Tax=Dichanthelium oligosanthes TaxID=888268 RepID=A0A1E5WJW8_9POAL|nr:hypothetical protein BAE44_0001551 [Dichanthelium oligosanthes]
MPGYYDIDDILMEDEVILDACREGCQGGPPILACAWAAVSGTSRVNKSTSMLHTEVGLEKRSKLMQPVWT